MLERRHCDVSHYHHHEIIIDIMHDRCFSMKLAELCLLTARLDDLTDLIAPSLPSLPGFAILESGHVVSPSKDILIHEPCKPTPSPPGPPTPPPPTLSLRGLFHRINPCGQSGRSGRVGTIVAPVNERGL